MTVRPWLISKDSDPDPVHPWYYTYRGPDCAAGGHYGSVETFARAVECVEWEARDHAENCATQENETTCPLTGRPIRQCAVSSDGRHACVDLRKSTGGWFTWAEYEREMSR